MAKQFARAAIAGAIGGLAGSWTMSEFQGWWSRRVDGREPHSSAGRHDARDWQEKNEGQNANEILGGEIAARALDRPPTRNERGIAAAAVHYAFGAAMGAVYGILAEQRGGAPPLAGAAWGTAVWVGADEIAVPLLGLARTDVSYPLESHLQSWAAHLVYGLTTESVERVFRSV
jgi:putative membrane protein